MAEQNENLNNRSLELCRRTVTTESFIEEAKAIYGNRYDYSKVEYINRDHRVVVTCPVHGDFQVYAREHLDGKGCPKCEKGDKFIVKLKEKFGDKFGLDEFVYESSTTPVTLVCPTHGAFSRLPNQILNAPLGCPECGKEFSLQKTKDRAENIKKVKLETQRKAKEEVENKWKQKIKNIQDGINVEWGKWFNNFFGFDFTNLTSTNGVLMHGMYNLKLDYSHYPFTYAEIRAESGCLDKAYFSLDHVFSYYADDTILDEILLACENIFSEGEVFLMEQVKEKYNKQILNKKGYSLIQITEHEYFIDGYKIKLSRGWDNVNICIRKMGARIQRNFNYQKYNIKALPNSFVGIDFETLYPQRVSACSVGMVKYIDGEIVDRYYTLIRPPFDYPGKCGKALTWVHGLTKDMVKNERTFEEILPEMEKFVDGLPLVAHNACVEKACIRDASAFYGLETKLDFENIYDTLYLSRQVETKLGISIDGPGTHQLDMVCRRFGVVSNNHHNALADAEMCGNLMAIFRKIISNGEAVEVVEPSKALRQKYNPEDKIQRTDLESVADNPFKNQVVVLTGFTKADSQEFAHKLNELGAIIKDGVNKKTNILITGYNAGPSKMQKAQEFGARIISEEEFKKIINQL